MATRTESPPYKSYAAIMGVFAAGLAAAGVAGRALGRDPQCQSALDFGVLSLAAFKTARTLARDPVTSFLRDPFVEGRAGVEDEKPVRSGDMEQAIGELVTCTRCVGTWAAAGLTATQIIAPRFGRLLTWSLGAAAVNDFLQAGFAAATAKTNRLEEQTES
ncbi:MAG: DUF1360 domain-containing protein [Actinomycetota bacterium]